MVTGCSQNDGHRARVLGPALRGAGIVVLCLLALPTLLLTLVGGLLALGFGDYGFLLVMVLLAFVVMASPVLFRLGTNRFRGVLAGVVLFVLAGSVHIPGLLYVLSQ